MKNKLIFPWPIWLILIVALGVSMIPLHGCAPTKMKGTCALKPIGQDEKGIHYFQYICEPAE